MGAVHLDQKLINTAKSYSNVECRSTAKQIEHWAKIGHIAEDNPDLTYEDIKGILLGLADVQMGNVEPYKDGML